MPGNLDLAAEQVQLHHTTRKYRLFLTSPTWYVYTNEVPSAIPYSNFIHLQPSSSTI
jgi:hypothetical protein